MFPILHTSDFVFYSVHDIFVIHHINYEKNFMKNFNLGVKSNIIIIIS